MGKIEYSLQEKSLEAQYEGYVFSLSETSDKLLEIDNAMQISVNHARMDLILSKQIIPVYVKKQDEYRIMILLKKADDEFFLLDYFCGVQKTVPDQKELKIVKTWCDEKKITLSNGVRL